MKSKGLFLPGARAAAAVWARLRYPNAAVYLSIAGVVSTALGIAVGNRYLLLVFDTVAVLPVWFWAAVQNRFQNTALIMYVWFVAKVAAVAVATVLSPSRAAAAVLFGPAYADATWRWLAAWELPAGVVLPPFPWLAVALAAATSAVTAGIGGVTVAATAANCQGYYLGILLPRATEVWRVAVFGYTPWIAFGTLGLINVWLAAAEPALAFVTRRPIYGRNLRDAAAVAALMLAAAYVAYATVEPWWRDQLAPSLWLGCEEGV